MTTFTTAQPLKPSERPPRRSLAEVVDAIKAGVRQESRKFYNRPIPPHAKAVMHRMTGERDD